MTEPTVVDLGPTAPSSVDLGGGIAIPGPAGKGVPEGGDIGQVLGKTGTDDYETGWVDQTGGGGTDLTSYVDQVETLPDYPAVFPPASHTHAMGQVDGLADALDGKQPTGDYLTSEDLPAPPDLSPYATKTALAGVESSIPTAPADIGAQPAGDYVTDDDPRLTDARTPLAHTHPASDVTGLAPVATSGAYGDLTGTPTIPPPAPVDSVNGKTGTVVLGAGDVGALPASTPIPATPQDIGAQPAGSYATGAQGALADTAVQPADLAPVATSGAYGDLTGLPLLVIDEGDPIPPGTPAGTIIFERTTP